MKYCHKCGNQNNEESAFCSQCGAKIREDANIQQIKGKIKPGCFLFLGIVILMAIFSPFVYRWLLGECGVLHVSKEIQRLEGYESHLQKIEDATVNNKKPSSYLLAQIDGDISSINTENYDSCMKISARAMNSSLTYASNYFSELPTFEISDQDLAKYGIMTERRYDYEDALREYYSEIGKIKSCHPFCNFETVFSFSEPQKPFNNK